jgi:hypothetical protein
MAEKQFKLAKDIHVVKDKKKDPVGQAYRAGKVFSESALRAAGVDDETRDHWIRKGVIVAGKGKSKVSDG